MDEDKKVNELLSELIDEIKKLDRNERIIAFSKVVYKLVSEINLPASQICWTLDLLSLILKSRAVNWFERVVKDVKYIV